MTDRSVSFEGEEAESIRQAAEKAGVPFDVFVREAAVRTAAHQRVIAAANEVIDFIGDAFQDAEDETAPGWESYRAAERAADRALSSNAHGTAA